MFAYPLPNPTMLAKKQKALAKPLFAGKNRKEDV